MKFNNTDDVYIYYRKPSGEGVLAMDGWDVQEMGVRDSFGSHPDPIGWGTENDCTESDIRCDDMYLVYDIDGELLTQHWREVQYPEALNGRHVVGWSLTDLRD